MQRKKSFLLIAVVFTIQILHVQILHAESAGAPSNDKTNLDEVEWLQEDSDSEVGVSTKQYNLIKQFLMAVIFVAIIGASLYIVSKKVSPRLSPVSGKIISVVDTVNLGAQKKLYLVELKGSRQILISSTNTNINFLTEINTAEDSNFKATFEDLKNNES